MISTESAILSNASSLPPSALTRLERDASSFESMLHRHSSDGRAMKTREEQAEEAARQLVATTFIQPLLEQLNEPTLMSGGPFMPGDAERRFAPLLQQHLADRIVEAGRFPLADAVKRSLLAKSHGAPPSGEATPGSKQGVMIDVAR
jgi:Rod binding domain-containing protein